MYNKLSREEYDHYCASYVCLTPIQHVSQERINVDGIRVRTTDAYKYNFTRNPNPNSSNNATNEIIIEEKVLRINLKTNCLNLKVTNDLFTPQRIRKNAALMLNNENADLLITNKSIIKNNNGGTQTIENKTVSFNNTFYITPISPRHSGKPENSYENTFKEYLKKMNGTNPPPPQTEASPPPPPPPEIVIKTEDPPEIKEELQDDDPEMIVEMLDDEPPRRGRGRPRGSGRLNKSYMQRPPPRDPNTPPKRRGWPLGLPRKKFATYKNVHRPYGNPPPVPTVRRGPGRPRKILAFSFQTIVTDIKSVTLPSELWSAHVSVTSKRAQVCFTRVVQNKTQNVPLECDRSVKFNGTVKYLVRINNRDVGLVGAPPHVHCLRDIEVLLNIVDDIASNDPVLEYFNR